VGQLAVAVEPDKPRVRLYPERRLFLRERRCVMGRAAWLCLCGFSSACRHDDITLSVGSEAKFTLTKASGGSYGGRARELGPARDGLLEDGRADREDLAPEGELDDVTRRVVPRQYGEEQDDRPASLGQVGDTVPGADR